MCPPLHLESWNNLIEKFINSILTCKFLFQFVEIVKNIHLTAGEIMIEKKTWKLIAGLYFQNTDHVINYVLDIYGMERVNVYSVTSSTHNVLDFLAKSLLQAYKHITNSWVEQWFRLFRNIKAHFHQNNDQKRLLCNRKRHQHGVVHMCAFVTPTK